MLQNALAFLSVEICIEALLIGNSTVTASLLESAVDLRYTKYMYEIGQFRIRVCF